MSPNIWFDLWFGKIFNQDNWFHLWFGSKRHLWTGLLTDSPVIRNIKEPEPLNLKPRQTLATAGVSVDVDRWEIEGK